jgi:hypothetical protein
MESTNAFPSFFLLVVEEESLRDVRFIAPYDVFIEVTFKISLVSEF